MWFLARFTRERGSNLTEKRGLSPLQNGLGQAEAVRAPMRRLLLLSRHLPASGKIYLHFKARTSRIAWDKLQEHTSSEGFLAPSAHGACCATASPLLSTEAAPGPACPGLPTTAPGHGVPHQLTLPPGWPVQPSTARKGVPPSSWRGSARLSPTPDIGVGEAH